MAKTALGRSGKPSKRAPGRLHGTATGRQIARGNADVDGTWDLRRNGVARGYSPAAHLDATRPIPTPAMAAQQLPKPWNTNISEALEDKYQMAYWASLPQGIKAFAILTDWIGPGQEEHDGPNPARAQIARRLFIDTCMEAPLYFCTEKITRSLLDAAEVLEDWTPTEDLITNEHGLYIIFEKGIRTTTSNAPKGGSGVDLFGREIEDPQGRSNLDLRGLTVTNVYFGTDIPNADPEKVGAAAVVGHPRHFPRSIVAYTHRIHISGLYGVPGRQFMVPGDLMGWNVGLSMSSHRSQLQRTLANGTMNWRPEDDMEVKLLGAFLLWIKQRILVHSTRRADRAARKRLANAPMRPNPEADINLVELRAKDYIVPPDKEDREAVEWHWRWVVRGHWRNQACGPKMKDHRPVWVEPYLKGPSGLPLKPPKATVFAVTR